MANSKWKTEFKPFNDRANEWIASCENSRLNVLEGSSHAGKSLMSTLAFCFALEKHPARLHLLAGYTKSTVGINLIDGNGYGIEALLPARRIKYENKDAIEVTTKIGTKILLISGAGRSNDHNRIQKYNFGLALFDHAELFHPTFIETALNITDKIFMEFLAVDPNHWIYSKYLDIWQKEQSLNSNYGLNYGHFTVADSPIKERIMENASMHDKDSDFYKQNILGERIIGRK